MNFGLIFLGVGVFWLICGIGACVICYIRNRDGE